MKLYKYRSFDRLEYTLDILLNERRHCAPFDKLNDPFEGIFLSVVHTGGFFGQPFGVASFAPVGTLKTLKSVTELPIPGGVRVCSLSSSATDVRLWSHYASGHTGIAIEIDFHDEDNQLHEVEYVEKLKECSPTLLTGPHPKEILRIKSHHWGYEQEYRIISSEEYYSVKGRITGIYLGLRTSQLMKEMLLRSLGGGIPIYATKLNEQTIEIEPLNQINV